MDKSYEETRRTVEQLRAACLKLQKCQTLPEKDLRGRYRKAYEAAQNECIELVKQCFREVVPWGLSIRESNMESADAFIHSLWDWAECKEMQDHLGQWCRMGDYENIMRFLRWFREKLLIVAAAGGAVRNGGEKLLEL